MALKFDPVNAAKQAAARSGSGNFTKSTYFSMAENETKYLRFISVMYPSYIVNHSCGVTNIDIRIDEWDDLESAGQTPACPQCGQPLSRNDIVGERPGVWGGHIHRFIQTSDPQRKGNFACLASNDNALAGIVPHTPDGKPMYACPICAAEAQKEKPKKPSYRLLGVAVEREIEQEYQTINGIQTPVIKGARDIIVTDDDGTQHPKVVLVDMGWKIFWEKVFQRFPESSISYYDWRITRTGASLDTNYAIDPINIEAPNAIDIEPYRDFIPDAKQILSRLGSPEYFEENGWAVPGFQAATVQQAAVAAATPAQAAPQPVPQPVPQAAPQAVPQAGAIPWDVAQGQVGQQ